MQKRIATSAFVLSALVAAVSGCEEQKPAVDGESAPRSTSTSRFDPKSAGTVRGHVNWVGALPKVPKLEGCSNPTRENGPRERVVVPHPNRPAIDPETGGVASAVVFLRGVDPARSREWDHPPVRVRQQDYRFRVLQGQRESSVGFVRVGDKIEMDSADPFFHAIHAEGAFWFSLTFPDPGQPLRRALAHKGLVELTSAAGYFWMRAYLFVDDHAYYARSGTAGDFVLDTVPAGDYELVCWMPNWLEKRHERDPETSLIIRLFFRPPVELRRAVTVRSGETTYANFEFSSELFSGQ
jgi:hypothetical protein